MLVKLKEDFEKSGTVYFRNRVAKHALIFKCTLCEAPLIEGYVASCFAGISLKCAKCDTISTTPLPSPGDVFPDSKTLLLRDELYRIGEQVEFTADMVVVQDAVHRAAIQSTKPRENENRVSPFKCLQRYCELTGKDQKELRARLDRFRNAGHTGCLDEPVMWATDVIENLANHSVTEREVAFTWLAAFANADAKWRHHPRFSDIAGELRGNGMDFFHTIACLSVAEVLFKEGNSVTFSIEDSPKKPDLYLRSTARAKRFVEVKVPKEFIAHPGAPKFRSFGAYISRKISKNKQISGESKGVFMFGLFNPSRKYLRGLDSSIEKYFCGGIPRKTSCSGAGIVQFVCESNNNFRLGHEGLQIKTEFRENPNFQDE